jgi:hypothetical protein
MTRRQHSKQVTAADLAAQLADDQQFQDEAAARESELRERTAAWRKAERPIVEDLHQVGVEVDSVWDLVNTSEPYPSALPVLVDHLETGRYPDRVLEGVARALAVRPAVAYWDRLKIAYLAAEGPDARDGIAAALAACATEAQLADLVELLSGDNGPSRIFLLRPIAHFGGEQGRAVLKTITRDPELGLEAEALLARN